MVLNIVSCYTAKVFRIFALIFILMLLALFAAGCNTSVISTGNTNPQQNIASDKKITLRSNNLIRLANGEWNPYTGNNLPGYGCDSRVVSEVFGQMGYRVEFGFFPWARAYYLAETGEYDGTLEWDDTPNHREAFYISSTALSDQEWVFYFRSDKPFIWNSLDDLHGKIVGITSNYAYSDAFTDLIKSGKVTFEEAGSDEANFKKLLSGHIDVFPIEKSVGKTILQNSFSPDEITQLKFDPKSFHDFHPYLLLSKEMESNADLIMGFNRGLIDLKRNPKYKEIMRDCQN